MSRKVRRTWTADAVMFGTTLLMGSSYPFAKDVLGVMSPLLYSASRYLVASLFLFAMLALMRRPMTLPQRDWVPMILLSLIGVSLFQACWGLAMTRSAPSLGSIVMTTTTAFSAILAWLGGRRLPALGWAGIVIAFLAGVTSDFDAALQRWSAGSNPFYEGPFADLLSMVPFLLLTVLLWLVARGKWLSGPAAPRD